MTPDLAAGIVTVLFTSWPIFRAVTQTGARWRLHELARASMRKAFR